MDNGIYLTSSKFGGDPTLVQLKVHQLLTRLSSKVLRGLLNAHGLTKLVNKISIYGLVECIGDLSNENCKTCIDTAISELPKNSFKRRSGHVIYGSCYISFSFDQFNKFLIVPKNGLFENVILKSIGANGTKWLISQ